METRSNVHSAPDIDRLSVLAAVIMLSFALSRVFDMPIWQSEWVVLGTNFVIDVDLGNLVLLTVGGLTAAGVSWLLYDHPGRSDNSTIVHWLLPSLAAVVVGLALDQIPFNPAWWLGMVTGGGLLIAVLSAEYIAVDSGDARLPLASIILMATAFTLYLILVVSLALAGFRLYVFLPVIFAGSTLVALRVLHLRLNGEWVIYESLLIAWIVTQFAAAFHYWPITAIRYGIWTLGILYAVLALFVGLIEERVGRNLYLEAGLGLAAAVLGGIVFG